MSAPCDRCGHQVRFKINKAWKITGRGALHKACATKGMKQTTNGGWRR